MSAAARTGRTARRGGADSRDADTPMRPGNRGALSDDGRTTRHQVEPARAFFLRHMGKSAREPAPV